MSLRANASPLSLLRLALALLIAAPALHAQAPGSSTGDTGSADPRIANVLSDLEQVRQITQTALSPDGRQIAWVLAEDGSLKIRVAPTADPDRVHPISEGPNAVCAQENLAWSPDSRELAFTSNCKDGSQADIYLVAFSGDSPSGSVPRRLTHLRGSVESLAFSPDGKEIGFLYVEGATRHPGALDAMSQPAGVIGVEGVEIQRVATVNLTSNDMRQVTPANLHVYEYDWSPDSTQIAYIAAPPPGENNWWIAQLYTQALSSAAPRSIFDPNSNQAGQTPGPLHGLQIAVPRWSPDGREIAFIGGLMSDQGATGGDLYMLPASGGSPKDVTPGRQSTPVWFYWLSDPAEKSVSPQSRIALVEIKGGSLRRAIINLRGEDSPGPDVNFPGNAGDGTLQNALSVSRDQDAFAYIQSSYSLPPAVMLTRSIDHRLETVQVTHVNDGVKPDWGRAESIAWHNDNFNIQGWLTYPANYEPGKKYPLIVSVHGGPSSAVLQNWPSVGYNGITFASLGYFVLQPNPRGSYGQGEAFTLANRKDFGYGDLRDILAGVDAVSAKLPIDQHRIGVTGWSYGGFMTMFAVTQTQRFRAAVAGAGISNWQSYYGENSIDQWMIPFFGASVYSDPGVYAKSSAIDFIQNVKTPTLIVVGGRDGECPAPQSFEFWHALRAEHIPTELVVYPKEGHRFASPDNRRDVLQRALAWFEQYMPAEDSSGVRAPK